MKIALATIAVGQSYREAVAIGLQSKRDYCARHGYEFLFQTDGMSERPVSWNKVLLLKREIPQFDIIFWSDADVVITNPKLRLEDIIKSYTLSGDTTFLIARDAAGNINAGNFFIFNTPTTVDNLDKIWNCSQFIDHQWWENMAIIHLYQTDREFALSCHVDETTPNRFNAYCHVGDRNKRFRPGDFLVHFAGVRGDDVLRRLMEDCYLRDRQGWDCVRLQMLWRLLRQSSMGRETNHD